MKIMYNNISLDRPKPVDINATFVDINYDIEEVETTYFNDSGNLDTTIMEYHYTTKRMTKDEYIAYLTEQNLKLADENIINSNAIEALANIVLGGLTDGK